MAKNLKIGITGGIGSGKSIVSDFVSEMGFPVIKADDVAKEVMLKNTEVKEKIIETFGKSAYKGKGLNKKFLAETIFSDDENLAKMNEIVHPPTIKQIKDSVYALLDNTQFVFVEAALLYEVKMQHIFDYVILVTADEDLRIKRVMERDGVTEEEVRARMKGQWQDSAKQDKADFMLRNEGTIEEFHKNIEFILQLLKRISLS